VFYLIKPSVEAFCSCAHTQHPGKLLNQVIGPLDFWMDQTELVELFLFLNAELLWTTKQEEGSLLRGGQSRCHRLAGSLILASSSRRTNVSRTLSYDPW